MSVPGKPAIAPRSASWRFLGTFQPASRWRIRPVRAGANRNPLICQCFAPRRNVQAEPRRVSKHREGRPWCLFGLSRASKRVIRLQAHTCLFCLSGRHGRGEPNERKARRLSRLLARLRGYPRFDMEWVRPQLAMNCVDSLSNNITLGIGIRCLLRCILHDPQVLEPSRG